MEELLSSGYWDQQAQSKRVPSQQAQTSATTKNECVCDSCISILAGELKILFGWGYKIGNQWLLFMRQWFLPISRSVGLGSRRCTSVILKVLLCRVCIMLLHFAPWVCCTGQCFYSSVYQQKTTSVSEINAQLIPRTFFCYNFQVQNCQINSRTTFRCNVLPCFAQCQPGWVAKITELIPAGVFWACTIRNARIT